MNSPITTHVLDTAAGRPAAGIAVELFRLDDQTPKRIGGGVTDSDGRIMTRLIESTEFLPGIYQIKFATANYFESSGTEAFYPSVTIEFVVAPGEQHYHVPLLLAPFGYSTYRGS